MTRFFFPRSRTNENRYTWNCLVFVKNTRSEIAKTSWSIKTMICFPKYLLSVFLGHNRFPERKTPSTNTGRRRKFIDSRQQQKEEREREKEEGNYQVNKKCACQSRRKQLYLLTELIYLRLLYARHAYGDAALILKKKNHEGIVDFTRMWLAVGLIDLIINGFFFVGYNFLKTYLFEYARISVFDVLTKPIVF